MAVEIRQVRMGEHFIEDALPRIQEIFNFWMGDVRESRYVQADIRVGEDKAFVRYASRYDPEGEIKRKAVIASYVKYSNYDQRTVETRLEEKSDGKVKLKIKDTLFDPPFGGASRKTVETATFTKDGEIWKIEDVSKVFIDEKKVESHLTHLTPEDVIAGTVLGHAWEVMEASQTSLRLEIDQQDRTISELLQ